MHQFFEKHIRNFFAQHTVGSVLLSSAHELSNDGRYTSVRSDTDRKGEGEKQPIERLDVLQATIDAVGDAAYVTGADLRFVLHNQSFQDMWQLSSEVLERGSMSEALVLIASQLLAPVDLERRSQEIINDAAHQSREILHCKDGRTIERTSSPLAVKGVFPVRIWVLRDVTQLESIKKATINLLEDLENEKNVIEEKVQERTKELRQEHLRFVTSIGSIPLGLLVLGANDEILIKNNLVRTLFQMDKLEYVFGDIDRVVPDVRLPEKIIQCLLEHMPVEVRDVAVGNKLLKIMIAPLGLSEKKDQRTLGVVLLIEDTTEARALERGRDEFFAIASHELRTPLTAIRGNMSLIEDYYQEAITDKEVLEMVRDTNSAALRLITIVNDFLDVSRLEQGHIAFQYDDFSAAELVDEVIEGLTEVGIARGISLLVEASDRALMVHADRDRTKQVLTNLVSNAINYSEHGTVRVSVNKDNACAEFLVHDEGIGISPQNQTLLFRKFQQAGTSVLTRDMTQSTGLGLYISRLVIEPMGGKIWLKSSISGEGSTFAFTLPLVIS